MNEEFVDIPGYEGLYKISRDGVVISIPRKSVNGCNIGGRTMGVTLRTGYPSVILTDKKGNWKHKRIHRLLAETFIANPKQKKFVDHIDGNVQNFALENLRWVTPKENAEYSVERVLWKQVVEVVAENQSNFSNLIRTLTDKFRIDRSKCNTDLVRPQTSITKKANRFKNRVLTPSKDDRNN